jgi:MoaA/NifB/PqqE/SkfB family radical SAM enzyme
MMGLGLYLTYYCNQSCPYCFKKNERKEMSLEDFRIFVDWVVRNGIREIKLAGGEPTTHPVFNEVVQTLRSRANLNVHIISNLACGEEKISAFAHCWVLANTSVPRSEEDTTLFENNLERVVALPGTRVTLSHTLWDLAQEDDHVVRYCKELGIGYVRVDFARASTLRRNKHVTLAQLPAFKEKMYALMRKLSEMDVWLLFDCPIPKDTFSPEELSKVKVTQLSTMDPTAFSCYVHYVNPDLTVTACPFRTLDIRRLDEFEDMVELTNAVVDAFHAKLQKGERGPVLCSAERFARSGLRLAQLEASE